MYPSPLWGEGRARGTFHIAPAHDREPRQRADGRCVPCRRPLPGRGGIAGRVRRPEDLQSSLRLLLCAGRVYGRVGRRLLHGARRAAGALHPAAGAGWPRGRPDRHRGRARPPPLRVRSRRDFSAPADLRAGAHARRPDPHDVGHRARLDGRALCELRPCPRAGRHRARVQPHRDRRQPRHRDRHRLASDAHGFRPHHPRVRQQSRDGGGARRGHAVGLRARLHARDDAGHAGGRPRHPGHGRHERDGHRDRRAPLATARPLRSRGHVRTTIVLSLAGLAMLGLPVVAPTYYVTLMLPFMAYGVILLGLNLLFGYTGLVSFGHALFIGVGAYTGAVMTTHFHVRHMELILPAAALAAAIVAAPVGALCVRYVKIYFGMLTLAFGMVFYTFLLKFYKLTGGDEGMRMLRPYLLGSGWEGFSKTAYLVGPYYYFSLGVLILATLLMWRIVRSPFGLCLKTIRDNPLKAESLGVSVPRYRWYAFMIAAGYAAVGGALLAPPTGNVDPTLAYWTHSGNVVFMVLLGGFASFFGPLLGAFAFIFLQDTVMSVFPYWRLIFGAILAFIVIFAPGGLMGLFARRRPAEASRA